MISGNVNAFNLWLIFAELIQGSGVDKTMKTEKRMFTQEFF